MNIPLHVEVVQKQHSRLNDDTVIELVTLYLQNFVTLTPGASMTESYLTDNLDLNEHVQCITFCNIDHSTELCVTSETEFIFHVYKLHNNGVEIEMMKDTSGEEVAAAHMWTLPHQEFQGLWESLVYDSKLKEDIVRYVETALDFAVKGVDSTLIACNRVVLLHGQPGTGKTSLCRALAQKLAVRHNERFPGACLFEINTHSLFSKWFAESGKLVARLFDHIEEVVSDPQLLVCVIVDEVESIAHARNASLTSHEPSDSIRAVNALLTNLDRLRRWPNAFVLTTSNITGAIDAAFVDRADLKRRVEPPSARAAYEILRGCCTELMARGVVTPIECLFELRVLEHVRFAESDSTRTSLGLMEVARSVAVAGMSGRALRRLPLLAAARRYHRSPLNMLGFVEELHATLHDQSADAADMLEPAHELD